MDKITVENQPGWSRRVGAAGYSAMRDAMATVLRNKSEPVGSVAMRESVKLRRFNLTEDHEHG
jgi:hypothetical protein